jgi:hypothetical protein
MTDDVPRRELPLVWMCPGCGAEIDISAPRSWAIQVCRGCRKWGCDWERATALLREIGPTDEPMGVWGF